MDQTRIQRPLAWIVAISLLVSGFFAASYNQAWAAPDPGVQRVKAFLSGDPAGNLATWSAELGKQGAFGQPLPFVTSSPGALIGGDDLISQAVAAPLAAVDNYAALTGKTFAINAPDGRTGTLRTEATQVDSGWRVDFTADLKRTVEDLDLRISNESPAIELAVTSGVTAEVDARVKFSIQEDGSGAVWLVRDSASPRIDVDVVATLAADAKAAVGILGVGVAGSTLTIRHHSVATLDDPNGDGRLAFTEDGATGELAADGSLAGLVNAVLDPQGTLPINDSDANTPGSVQGQLALKAEPAGAIAGLDGAVNASVTINWPDISKTDVTLTTEGFDLDLAQFQHLTLQNLADGLARVITAITAIQQRTFEDGGAPTGNLDLPFMRGTLADAVEVVGPLKKFLADNVWSSADADPVRVGTPKFSSLQDLLTRLDATMDLGAVDWDPATNKFVIPLGFSSAAPETPEDLDKAPDADPAAPEDPVTNNAEIGAIVFADALQVGGSGIAGANAEVSLAKVKPSHQANITLVLDLRTPVTGNDCIPHVGRPCPYDQEVAGMNLTVGEWPLPTDRIMLRTGATIYSANFPITSDINFDARAGFFKVNVAGKLEVCSSGPEACSAQPADASMVEMALHPVGDAQHDVRLSELVNTVVTDPGKLLDPDITIKAKASAKVTVPNLEGFLPDDALEFTFDWADLKNPAGAQLNSPNLAKLASLDFDHANPNALFGIVLKQLQTLVVGLAEASPADGGSAFTTEIPGLGRSLRDLMVSDEANGGDGVTFGADTLTDATRTGAELFGDDMIGRAVTVGTQVNIVKSVSGGGTVLTMVDDWDAVPIAGTRYSMRAALLDALDWLVANNPDTIQDLVAQLNGRLSGTPLKVRYLDGAEPSIVLDLDWQRDYRTDTPLSLDISGVGDLVSASTTGQAQANVKGGVKVGLVVPLSLTGNPGSPAELKVMQDSGISVHAHAEATDGLITGSIGGLSLSIGNPDAEDARAVVKADLGVAIGVPGGTGTPVTWPAFIGAAKVQLNPDGLGASVSCESGLEASLMACANLPLYAKGVGGEYTSVGDVKLRLPRTSDPSDLIPTGNLPAPNAGTPKLEYPADLPARIASAVLDFSSFEHGIDGYLAAAEAGLRFASLDGKIPLVGKDLQQGADFLGKLRTTLKEDVLGGLVTASPDEWVTEVNTRLTTELDKAGFNAINPAVGLECSAVLEPAGAPTLTAVPVPDADADTYQYAIVAYQSSGDTIPGTPTSVEQKALTAENAVKVDWVAVEGATGYKVLRKGPNEGDPFLQVHSGTGLTFTDQGADGTAYEPVADKPVLDKCPASEVIGVTFEVTITGEATAASRPLDLGLPGLSLKADANSTQQGVSAELSYELHLKAGLNRGDGFYIATRDAWGGTDGTKAMAELGVHVTVEIPSEMQAKIAFIGVDVTSKTTEPAFKGSFQVDLKAPDQAESCFLGTEAACAPDANAKLRFADLVSATPSSLFAVSLAGGVDIDWHLASRIEVDGDANLLPGIEVDFKLTWAFDNKAPTAVGLPKIEFNDFEINAGDVFSNILGPILEKVKSITGPIQPIIDAIYAPLPVLSDVSKAAGGDDISLFTLAKTFNTLRGGPSLEMVERLADVVKLINSLPECGADKDCMIPLGSFQVKPAEAMNTSLTPDVAASLITDAAPNPDVLADLNAADDKADDTFDPAGGDNGAADKAGIKFPIFQEPTKAFALLLGGDVDLVTFDSGPLSLGFSFSQEFGPVYAPPPVLLTISGSASITAQIRAGMDTYGIRKAIENKDAGLRTQAVSLLDGLYFATTDEQGRPAPVVTLRGELAAGAMVSVVVVSVGVKGGLGLTIGMYWNDPNDDGKFRVSEFLTAALNNPMCLFEANGRIYLFLELNLKIGVSIFSVEFSVRLVDLTLVDFTLAADCSSPPPEVGGIVGDTLYVFAGKLGTEHYRGSTWGTPTEEGASESIKITQMHFAQKTDDPDGTNPDYDGMKVQMLGITREFHDPGIKRVVVDGTGGDAALDVSFSGDGMRETNPDNPAQTTGFDRAVFVQGTAHDDKITAGSGHARIDGGAGDDFISTADTGALVEGVVSDAWVAGNAGNDSIVVGDGDDKVTGDATLGFTKNTEELTLLRAKDAQSDPKPIPKGTVIDPASAKDPLLVPLAVDGGNDTIRVGLGETTVDGNGGNDVISVTTDTATKSSKGATLIGGHGNDNINGGAGNDVIHTGPLSTFADEFDGEGPADEAPTGNVVNSGAGNDLVWGSQAVDKLSSGSLVGQSTKMVGGLNDDVLTGGHGSDRLFGGPGDDYVIAEPALIGDPGPTRHLIGGIDYGPLRQVTVLPLPAGTTSSPKTLVGGLGNDHIQGGDADSLVYGDKLIPAEQCVAGDPVTSDPIAESTSTATGDGNDFILGGAGVDTVSAGGGHDRVQAGGGDDLVCGQEGDDWLDGQAGRDHLWGGSGTDTIWGGADDDFAFGNAGEDTLYGGDGVDSIEGNAGADWASGGSGDDLIVGGTSATGREDVGDRLFGDSGDDVIAGDNAVLTVVPVADTEPILRNRMSEGRSIVLLDLGDSPVAGAFGADEIRGGAGADAIFGQGGHDRLRGDAGPDLIEGGTGSDWLEGNDGDDDLIGGSSWILSGSGPSAVGQPDEADAIFGGSGDDVVLGDNGRITRPSAGEPSVAALKRLGSAGDVMAARWIDWYDLAPGGSATRYGADRLSGGDGVDAIWGQDGDDAISGDGGGDYLEGNGGADSIRGDRPLGAASDVTPDATLLPDPGWPGAPGTLAQLMGTGSPDGQDDIIGGSARSGFRDTGDRIEGNGGDDVVLGDNGTLVRVVEGMPGEFREAVYTDRYPIGAVPTDATRIRVPDPAAGAPSTRFCTEATATCEPAGAFGSDVIHGDDGDDGLWGQDGDDLIHGGNGNDEVYGELGEDLLFGDAGDDVILGDRGGVVTTFLDGDRGPAETTVSLKQPPRETFTAFRRGTLDRRVDLMHDTDGIGFLGSSTRGVMPHPGTTVGGDDRMRGGLGQDVLFAGYGDDLANGDSGGDVVFGGDGEDVLWGGRGCDPLADATTADCLVGGAFDPSARGDGDRFVDLVFGGAGELDQAKQDVLGADILDWAPRGAFEDCVTGRWPVTIGDQSNDPCAWFEMTSTDDGDVATNQHHHGVDWIYGGLDRDVLQGDVTANGPNGGDRLMDTTGAFNLFSHCNAAYGGFNDVRVMAPAVRDFLFLLAYSAGAGQTSVDVTTRGTAAYADLAMVYNSDMKRGAGKAFPTTPGHFDQGACQP